MYGETFYGRTTPADVKANKNQKLVPLRAMKTRWVKLRSFGS